MLILKKPNGVFLSSSLFAMSSSQRKLFQVTPYFASFLNQLIWVQVLRYRHPWLYLARIALNLFNQQRSIWNAFLCLLNPQYFPLPSYRSAHRQNRCSHFNTPLHRRCFSWLVPLLPQFSCLQLQPESLWKTLNWVISIFLINSYLVLAVNHKESQ